MNKFIIYLIAILALACGNDKENEIKPLKLYYIGNTYSYRIIEASNNTWGFDIMLGDKVIFHQQNLPLSIGFNGFNTKQQASYAAKFAISKMEKGEIPPKFHPIEVDSLNSL